MQVSVTLPSVSVTTDMLQMLVLKGLLENPPPFDNPHNVIVCGDDQDAVTDAKQLIDCQSGFKVGPLAAFAQGVSL